MRPAPPIKSHPKHNQEDNCTHISICKTTPPQSRPPQTIIDLSVFLYINSAQHYARRGSTQHHCLSSELQLAVQRQHWLDYCQDKIPVQATLMSAGPKMAAPLSTEIQSPRVRGCVLGGVSSGFAAGSAAIWRGTAVGTAGRGRGFGRAVARPTQSRSRDLGTATSSSSVGADWSGGLLPLSEGLTLQGGQKKKQFEFFPPTSTINIFI